jgi:hypothetical protein
MAKRSTPIADDVQVVLRSRSSRAEQTPPNYKAGLQ